MLRSYDALIIFFSVVGTLHLLRTGPSCVAQDETHVELFHKFEAHDDGDSSIRNHGATGSTDKGQTTTVKSRMPGSLPETVISVFGLESSGTTFVYESLGSALKLERKAGDSELTNLDGSIRLQHLSLPTGYFYREEDRGYANLPLEIVPYFIPNQCFASSPQINSSSVDCSIFGRHLKARPSRVFVNITSHIAWYRSQGVDAKAVVVVRDTALHFHGILKVHCPNETAAYEQFKTGKRLLQEATRTVDPVLVSYETLLTLRGAYWRQVMQELNITSDFIPKFRNGNVKYVPSTPKSIQPKLGMDNR